MLKWSGRLIQLPLSSLAENRYDIKERGSEFDSIVVRCSKKSSRIDRIAENNSATVDCDDTVRLYRFIRPNRASRRRGSVGELRDMFRDAIRLIKDN